MTYYSNTTIDDTFINSIAAALKNEEFGILTEIDVAATLKAFPPLPYTGSLQSAARTSGANRRGQDRHDAPVPVIVQELGPGRFEIAAINPLVAMDSVGNPALSKLAETVVGKLQRSHRGNLKSCHATAAAPVGRSTDGMQRINFERRGNANDRFSE